MELIKKTAKENFEATMLGDIGIVHDKVDALNAKLAAINAGLPALTAGAVEVLGVYDLRAERMYAAIVNANVKIDMSTDLIAGAARLGVDQLAGKMGDVAKQSTEVVNAMITMLAAIEGKNGVAAKIDGVAGKFDGNMWQLERAVAALSKIQHSPLAAHAKSVVAVQMLVVSAVSALAGAALNPATAALSAWGVGVLSVGVLAGWAIAKLYSKPVVAG